MPSHIPPPLGLVFGKGSLQKLRVLVDVAEDFEAATITLKINLSEWDNPPSEGRIIKLNRPRPINAVSKNIPLPNLLAVLVVEAGELHEFNIFKVRRYWRYSSFTIHMNNCKKITCLT